MSHDAVYGRTEDEWQQLEDAGWELSARTGQPPFDFGQQAGRVAMGHLLGRISRNRSWPASGLLISALGPLPGRGRRRAGIL